jgi:hypothetical protein
VGLTTLSCNKKIVEKPPRNSAGFCGGGQGLSWAVEPRKEEEEEYGCPTYKEWKPLGEQNMFCIKKRLVKVIMDARRSGEQSSCGC